MARSTTVKRVLDVIREPIETAGLILWDVRYLKEGASWYLRIFIDSEKGVGIDDCTNVSHLIDPILDEHDFIRDSYYLEVCSPGIERELIEPEHFIQSFGKSVKIKLIRPQEGIREFIGTLKKYDGNIEIETENGSITFLKADIASVRLNDFI